MLNRGGGQAHNGLVFDHSAECELEIIQCYTHRLRLERANNVQKHFYT